MANAHSNIDSLIIMNKFDEIMKNQGQGYDYQFDTPRDKFGELGRNRLAQGDSTQFKVLPRNERNPLEAILGLIGGMQNPLARMLNPARKGETLGQTWNEYSTGEVNPNVIKAHQAEMDKLRPRNAKMDSILQNYVNGLMEDKKEGIPGLQGGPPLNNNY
jgi:hypothetical protein